MLNSNHALDSVETLAAICFCGEPVKRAKALPATKAKPVESEN
jgi:hypothetical protein